MYREWIFNNGEHHFSTLLKDIAQANHTIDLETYIFQNDCLGKDIILALIKAARRGVKVRVMVDGVGSPFWGITCAALLEKAGIETKVFHPFPWQLWNWSRSMIRWPFLLKGIYLILKINFRNHRKVWIIDNRIIYIGSFNISKRHLCQEKGGDNWRDTSVRLLGLNREVRELKKAFDAAWNHRTIKERLRDTFRQVRQDPAIRLNYTRHRRRILYKNLLRKISQCRQRIWLTNAYFVPDNFLLKKLKEAAAAGIDVRILLPKKSDVMMMPWASSTFYFSLLKVGVRIFEYLPSILHAKTLILDNWMLVGTSNLNHRSLLHDLEADVKITSTEAKQALVRQFLNDIQCSREVSLQNWQQLRSRIQRVMGRLVLYMKYWI